MNKTLLPGNKETKRIKLTPHVTTHNALQTLEKLRHCLLGKGLK